MCMFATTKQQVLRFAQDDKFLFSQDDTHVVARIFSVKQVKSSSDMISYQMF
jgi:hypothetical protein